MPHHESMQQKRTPNRSIQRKGAALVEAALALPLFLFIVFGMIDLGIGVLRYNLASEAARIGARHAIVHGSDAETLGKWTKASAEPGIHERLEPLMAASAIASDDFRVEVTYEQNGSDDDNAPGSPVVVRVEIDYDHIVPYLDFAPITIAAESSMIISN